jgi:hypothetical protein
MLSVSNTVAVANAFAIWRLLITYDFPRRAIPSGGKSEAGSARGGISTTVP